MFHFNAKIYYYNFRKIPSNPELLCLLCIIAGLCIQNLEKISSHGPNIYKDTKPKM